MQKTIDTVEEYWGDIEFSLAKKRANENSIRNFRKSLASFFEITEDHIEFTPSAHLGLEVLLSGLKHDRRLVLVPKFNCEVVEKAIINANCDIECYDFSQNPGYFDWSLIENRLSTGDIGAIIVTHYFGVPVDFRKIIKLCRNQGIVVIEDCAHTLGGKIGGKMAGLMGDAAIFSFNFDKPISLGWGGFVIINNRQLFDKSMIFQFLIPNFEMEEKLLVSYRKSIAFRRRLIPFKHNPALRLLKKIGLFNRDSYKIEPNILNGQIQAELGMWCLERYNFFLQQRNKNARILMQKSSIKTWPVAKVVEPAWLRQKVACKSPREARNLSVKFQRIGIRVGNFNWSKLINAGAQKGFNLSKNVSDCWIDVPIHQNLSTEQISFIATTLVGE